MMSELYIYEGCSKTLWPDHEGEEIQGIFNVWEYYNIRSSISIKKKVVRYICYSSMLSLKYPFQHPSYRTHACWDLTSIVDGYHCITIVAVKVFRTITHIIESIYSIGHRPYTPWQQYYRWDSMEYAHGMPICVVFKQDTSEKYLSETIL